MESWDGGVPILWETSKVRTNFPKLLPAAYELCDAINLGIRGFQKIWDVARLGTLEPHVNKP